jgi:transcriptional regulator with XRE-family HTH domain
MDGQQVFSTKLCRMPLTIADVTRKKPAKNSLGSDFGMRLMTFRTQRAISYYETGLGFPPAPLVARLAHALKISADELLGIKPQPRDVSNFEKVNSDPEGRRLWKKFQQMASLPQKDQRAVIRLINSLSTVRASEARA